MEEELVQLFQAASKAADAAAVRVSGGDADESRCIDALKQLKTFPVTSQVLVSTQIGKGIRRLTKHPKKKIQAFASDVIQIWKQIVTEESNGCKRKDIGNGGSPGEVRSSNKVEKDSPVRADQASKTATLKARNIERNDSPASVKVEKDSPIRADQASETATLKARKIERNDSPASVKVEKSGHAVIKSVPDPGPQKLKPLVKCNDPMRDKVRELLHEALSKVSGEAEEDMIGEVNACDPSTVAVSVESVMHEKWGKMNGAHKIKYRSLMFNIKDQNNPDFRRKILLGQIKPERLLTMTTQEMASNQRQKENQKIKEKAMNECELGGAPKATTDQFKCGRCGQRKCTYYQMQTRSADEPMTTYVTCVNCNNHWKFC